jgi:alpha-tubulin suppressor-like RCC1 family protein
MQRRFFALSTALALAAACVERGEVLVPPETASGAGSGGISAGAGGIVAGAGGMPDETGGTTGATAGTSGATGGGGASAGEPSAGNGGEGGAPEPSVLRASEVRTGYRHTCAVYAGAAYCWGDNADGQLGLGDFENRSVPTRVPGDRVWRHLALGESHTCALDDLGRVYCWGLNGRGQLGTGDRETRDEPSLVALPNRALALSADFEHSCALLSDFMLFCWGKNYEGELGQDDSFPGEGSVEADGLTPLAVGGADWSAVDTGQGHTCAIALDGGLYCWGRNSKSELGTEPDQDQVRRPTRVGSDADWLDVDAGQHHTCGVREDLSLWCWGQNTGSTTDEGYPLGVPGVDQLDEPTLVEGSGWTVVRTNTFHSCALEGSSDLYCWGRNAEGQLGLGDTVSVPTPLAVPGNFAAISVARFNTCALTTNGVVACAGKNEAGELGTGDLERRNVLTEVVAPAP